MTLQASTSTIRLVDYRRGSDDDLAKIHAVESEVESERRPGQRSAPVAEYIASARALPDYFHETTWLAEGPDGEPVAAGAAWFRDGQDARVLECDVWVRAPWRRRGVATRVLAEVCAVAEREGRSVVLGHSTDRAPAGAAFARALGADVAQVARRSELRLADVDWDMVQRWVDEGPRRAAGYVLEVHDGPYPEDRWDDAVALRDIMQTAPADDIDEAPKVYAREMVAADDEWILGKGTERWTIFARHVASGALAGGTNVYLEPWAPHLVDQGDTGVHPDHRGHALGKWLKAAMLLRIRSERPAAEVVWTGNASSNAPMLGINVALGFRPVWERMTWQVGADTLRAALAARLP